jgi:hypothetical protein
MGIQHFIKRDSKNETLMSNEQQDKIKNIVAQLKRLQTQESELLQRLERLSEVESQSATSPIGDKVQIKNPKPFQIKKGIVMRMGADADRITAQSKNGSKIVRGASCDITHVD